MNTTTSSKCASIQHIAILNKGTASGYEGSALSIQIYDPDEVLGRVATLCFTRPGRCPAVLKHTVVLDDERCGRFFGWGPIGLEEVYIEAAGGCIKAHLRKPLVKIRRVHLTWAAFMVMRRFPSAALRTWELLIANNRRGFRYRFARLYDRLNEPSYPEWLKRLKIDGAASSPTTKTSHEPWVFFSIVGDGKRAEATRQSLSRQSYDKIREIPCGELNSIGAEIDATGFWIRLHAGDLLDERAVELLLQPFLSDSSVAAVYCDEDQINSRGIRSNPFFKPAWNPPLAETGWLAPDGALIRAATLGKGLNSAQCDAGQLLLDAGRRGKIIHLPRILLHRVSPRRPALASFPKQPIAKTEVSIIVPTRDRPDLLRTCLEGVFRGTRHDALDVIVMDNGSQEPETLSLLSEYSGKELINWVKCPGSFNFALACNLGVQKAQHEMVLLLNNDVEPLSPAWLDYLVAELDDASVGAAGALLLFPDGFIQHAGITLGSGSVARHSFQFRKPNSHETFGLIDQRQEMSAVTGACLLTRRSLWNAVGGMDETHLAVAFNDVDYCLRLQEIGKRVIWTPHARLIHRESVSRGPDNTPEKLTRFAAEEAYMHSRWGGLLKNDPFYSPNLSLTVGDRSLAVQPRSLSPRVRLTDQ